MTKIRHMIMVVVSPVKGSEARQKPKDDVSPGQVSEIKYVGLSTGNTMRNCAES